MNFLLFHRIEKPQSPCFFSLFAIDPLGFILRELFGSVNPRIFNCRMLERRKVWEEERGTERRRGMGRIYPALFSFLTSKPRHNPVLSRDSAAPRNGSVSSLSASAFSTDRILLFVTSFHGGKMTTPRSERTTEKEKGQVFQKEKCVVSEFRY